MAVTMPTARGLVSDPTAMESTTGPEHGHGSAVAHGVGDEGGQDHDRAQQADALVQAQGFQAVP